MRRVEIDDLIVVGVALQGRGIDAEVAVEADRIGSVPAVEINAVVCADDDRVVAVAGDEPVDPGEGVVVDLRSRRGAIDRVDGDALAG